MKTDISIPDQIFNAAEELARRLECSRSELYARALSEFVRRHSHEGVTHEGVTKSLDELYGGEDARPDEELLAMQKLSIGREEW